MCGLRNTSSAGRRVLAFLRRLNDSVRQLYRRHQAAILGLTIIGATAFFVRYLPMISKPAPPGADYGNYLTNLHAFLGNDVTGQGVQYPAIFPAYLWILVSLLGEIGGLQFSGPFLGATICVPTYVLLRTYVNRPFSLVGTAMITFAEGVSEMIGWGGNPNLLGMIFGTFSVAFLVRFITGGSRRHLLASSVTFGLLAGSHQISLAYFGFASILAIPILAAKSRSREVVLRSIAGVGLGAFASAPFLPFYLTLASSSSGLLPSRPTILTLDDLVFIVGWLFRESLVLWIPIAFVALLGYRRLGTSNPVGFAFGVSLFVAPFLSAATIMAVDPVRPMYFVYLGITPGAMVFAQSVSREVQSRNHSGHLGADPATVATALVLAFSVVLVSSAYRRAVQATDWYLVVGDDVLDGLRWIQQHTSRDTIVATSGPTQYGAEKLVGCTWGWWIEGYAQRKSFCTANLQGLSWSAQVSQAIEANRAFAGTVSIENGWLRLGDYAPYGSRGNPLVTAQFGQGYEALVYFDDARVVVQWRPDNSSSMRTETIYYIGEHTSSQVITRGHARLNYTARGDGVVVQRIVELPRASGLAWVNYSFFVAGTIDRVAISVFGTSASRPVHFDYSTDTLIFGSVPGFRERAGGSVRISAGGDSFKTAVFAENPETSLPEVRFDFSPSKGTYSVSFVVQANYDQTVEPNDVRFFESRTILAEASVRLVFVDKLKVREMEWFAKDGAHFRIAYENLRIALFEMI